MSRSTTNRLHVIARKWRKIKKRNVSTNSNADIDNINKFADETIDIINGDNVIKDVCEAYLFSISVKAIKDPNYDDINRKLMLMDKKQT